MEYENEMCERLIRLSFAKIVGNKNERGACLRKNLLIFQLLQKARSEQQRIRERSQNGLEHSCCDRFANLRENHVTIVNNGSDSQMDKNEIGHLEIVAQMGGVQSVDSTPAGEQQHRVATSSCSVQKSAQGYLVQNDALSIHCGSGNSSPFDWQPACKEAEESATTRVKRRNGCDEHVELPQQKRQCLPLESCNSGSTMTKIIDDSIEQPYCFFHNSGPPDPVNNEFTSTTCLELTCES